MPLETRLPLLEQLLDRWSAQLGADRLPYQNHCYRMLNFCFALAPEASAEDREKMVIAAAFHDIGIWSDGTLDYLPPSCLRAADYLREVGKTGWIPEIERLIDEHHKLRSYRDARFPLAEVFRKADLVDVSLGMVRYGIAPAEVQAIKAAFPNAGFHKRLLSVAGSWFRQHPLSPPPFLKW